MSSDTGSQGVMPPSQPTSSNPPPQQPIEQMFQMLVDFVQKDQKLAIDKAMQEVKKDLKKEFQSKLDETAKQHGIDIEKQTRQYESKIDSTQIRAIETLGIFFALFTFISINVQIFSRITSLLSASFFTILLFCLIAMMLIMFNFVLMLYNRSIPLWKHSFIHLGLFLVPILIGAATIYFLKDYKTIPEENTIEFNNAVDKRIEEKVSPFYQKIVAPISAPTEMPILEPAQ